MRVAIGELAAATIGACERMLAAAPQLPVTEAIGEDADALDLVLAGRADFALVGAPLRPRDRSAGLREESIGFELFALAVPEESPVDSLACSVVRRILAGEITHWRQLGYPMGPIVLVLPRDDATALRGAWALAPRDPRRGGAVPGTPAIAMDAVRFHDDAEAREWTIREPGAIVLVRTDGVDPELHAAGRLVPIDGTAPTRAAFRAGAYPLGIDVRLVTPGAPRGAAARFLAAALGAEGPSRLAGRLASP